MKKAILFYNSNNSSNAIASSTMSNLEVNPITGLTVERKNMDKINVMKYLKQKREENDLPYVMYIYEHVNNTAKNINLIEEFPEVKFELYNKNFVYSPQRVPGNTLKTNVYLLVDKIALDYQNNFEKINVYKINNNDKTIKEEKRTAYDMKHPLGNSHNCYLSKEEAVNAIKKYMDYNENIYISKIEQLSSEIKQQEEKLTQLKKENLIAINNIKRLTL